MTAQPTEPEVFQAPHVVVATAGTRLEQLHASYAHLKAEADEASARLKACTDAIKAELSAAAPEAEKVDLRGEGGPPLRLMYVKRATFDSTRLKRERPDIYVTYAKFGGSWQLRAVSGLEDGE